jgi:hypothetical protein
MPAPQGESIEFSDQEPDKQTILIEKLKESIDQLKNLQTKREDIDRHSVKKFLKAVLSEIAEFYHQQFNQISYSRVITNEFIFELAVLQKLVYCEFLESRNRDLLNIFLRHGISPISDFKIQALLNKTKPDEIKAATTLQRFFRSKKRKELHSFIFKQSSQSTGKIPKSFNSYRLQTIIDELAVNHTAINPIQYHWTTLNNFASILRNNYIFGNEILKNNRICFEPNALVKDDVANGDGKAICFCPYLVDHDALANIKFFKMKNNIIRLSLNLKQIEIQGKYNQFFKLRDFGSPDFHYDVKINDNLSISVQSKIDHFYVNISLNKHSIKIDLHKNRQEIGETICYGDLLTINRFCLTQLLRIVDKANDPVFTANFHSYLNSLNDDEIKKILVVFAQSLTVYAEYNFNSALKLTTHLISAIHIVNSNKTFHLDHLSSEEYHQLILGLLQECNLDFNVPATTETIVQQADQHTLCFYGNQIDMERRTTHLIDQDFSKIPAEHFANNHYIETRPNLAPASSPDTQLKFGY